ncbi:MAG: DUF2867 domain-containing protein [Pseudomonas sp.]
MPPVHRCDLPTVCSLSQLATGAAFIDCRRIDVSDTERSAMAHALRAMSATPRWIDNAMKLRNAIVRRLGLKDLGSLTRIDLNRDEASYQPGERIGIFTLVSNQPDEVVMADKDKHLDVYLALNRLPINADGTRTLVMSTVVHTHNWLGTLYMLPVAPFHRLIAPLTLQNVNR